MFVDLHVLFVIMTSKSCYFLYVSFVCFTKDFTDHGGMHAECHRLILGLNILS